MVSLLDYSNDRENVVLFCVSHGMPMGDHFRLGTLDDDFAERRNLLNLLGTVGASGDWYWNGEDEPIDDQFNTIRSLHAYVDAGRWQELAGEFQGD